MRALLLSLLGVGLWSPGAWALPALDVLFTGRNGMAIAPSSSVVAAPGDRLTASLVLSAGPEGVSSYGLSIEFDADLADELDLESATELLPSGFDFNLTPGVGGTRESDATQSGLVLTFEAATFGFGPTDSSFEIGVVEFLVTGNVATDGDDIQSGFFGAADGIFDNLGGDLSGQLVLGSAAVNVPEPGSALLVALGLVGSCWLRRP